MARVISFFGASFFASFFVASVLLALNPLPALAQAPADAPQILDTLSRYLARTPYLSARFVQTNPNGEVLAGRFYLARPGRLRFAYTIPRGLLIVADGAHVFIRAAANEEPDVYPLEMSPLGVFLHYDIDLARSGAVVGMARQGAEVALTLRDPDQDLPGELVMRFAYPQARLLGWTVRDAQGKEIVVHLHELREETELDPRLFVLEP